MLTNGRFTKPKVSCMRKGCTGFCPLLVVVRSNKPDGAPALCQVCGQVYKRPKGAQQLLSNAAAAKAESRPPKGIGKGAGKGKGKGRGHEPGGADSALAKQAKAAKAALEKIQEEMRELKESIKGKTKDDSKGAVPPEEITRVNSKIREVEKSLQAMETLPDVLRARIYNEDGAFDTAVKNLEKEKADLMAQKIGLRPLDMRETSAKTYADKCVRHLDEAEKEEEKIGMEIKALQEKLHTQGTIVRDKRETSNKANEELAKIKEEVATAARSSSQMPKQEQEGSAKDQEPKSDEDGELSPELDLKKLLKECSKEKLHKLGYIRKPPAEDGNESQQSSPEGSEPDFKKQKMSIPEFEDLLGDMWNTNSDGKAQEGEEYDLWVQKQQKCTKFSPY